MREDRRLTDTSEQDDRRRRRAAWKQPKRALWRPSTDRTVGKQPAAPAADAGSVYDVGEWADVYGDGVVAELEERVARTLGIEAAAF